jgi:hypothetical protein
LFEDEGFPLVHERAGRSRLHLLVDVQVDVGATARSANTPMAPGGEYPREFAAGDDDKVFRAGVRESPTTNVQYPAKYPTVTILRVRSRNRPSLSIEIRLAHP